ncbi:hypothetical protein J6590_000504 [Homalodisca vitripennis]|nr:hypothetical protein J6590_000504 [Homalodisca vitripennis]
MVKPKTCGSYRIDDTYMRTTTESIYFDPSLRSASAFQRRRMAISPSASLLMKYFELKANHRQPTV